VMRCSVGLGETVLLPGASAQCGHPIVRLRRGESPAASCRIHSRYLGEKPFPKEITEFEIREFFTLSA
jgi:hypothetical protein